MKINIKWVLIGILVFILVASVYAAFTDESRYVGVRSTGDSGDAIIPILVAGALPVNISAYGMKEYTTTITDNNTNISISFDSLMEHLIIQPNISTVNWRFKIIDDDGYTIYDGTDIDQTGRLGLIVDLPLLGITNFTIQNVSTHAKFNIKVVYT